MAEKGTMRLTDTEKGMRDGNQGEAVALAMAVLLELGGLFGARRLIPVAQVHIDTTLFMVEAGAAFAEKVAALGGRFAVPTSLNPSAVDLLHPGRMRVPAGVLENNRRLERAYLGMGAAPTWTCTPYQHGLVPRFGQHIAWGESNAIAFANSVIGARTNRCADLMDVCAALTGRVPAFGLHFGENRRADLVFDLSGLPPETFDTGVFYPLLGYHVGGVAGDRVAAVAGLPPDTDTDRLKQFYAAAASSGGVGLVHLAGITPEAPELACCLVTDHPVETVVVTMDDLEETRGRLHTRDSGSLDWVAVGCPHYSFGEFRELARLLTGKHVHPEVAFWVYTCRAVYAMIENSGLLGDLAAAGVTVFTDGCPLQYPGDQWAFTAVMTDSGKFANYAWSQTGLHPAFGSLADCVASAVNGRVTFAEARWRP
jgi:predicted aconitase